jgi:hypothetical protein
MTGKCGPQQIEFPDGTCSGNVCEAMQVLDNGFCVPCDTPQGKRYENGVCYDLCKPDETFIAKTVDEIYDEMCAAAKAKGAPCNFPYVPNKADMKPFYGCVKKCAEGQTYIRGKCESTFRLLIFGVLLLNLLLLLVLKVNAFSVIQLDFMIGFLYLIYIVYTKFMWCMANKSRCLEQTASGTASFAWSVTKAIGNTIIDGVASIFS